MASENKTTIGCGSGSCLGTIGTIIAAVLSWQVNHSWLWVIIHGLLSWFYVIYYALGFGH